MQIDRVIPNQAPSLLNANKANELIDILNGYLLSKGVGDLTVNVANSGRMTVSLNPTSVLASFSNFGIIDVVICKDGSLRKGRILFQDTTASEEA